MTLGVVAVLAIALPSTASSAVRYAEPNGDGPEPCTQTNPCDLAVAASTGDVADGDEVVVLPGEYQEPGGGDGFADPLEVTEAVHIHGTSSQFPPRLRQYWLNLDNPLARASDLELPLIRVVHGLAERMRAFNGCHLLNDATIRDSVCWGGVEVHGLSEQQWHPELRNVTAVDLGPDDDAILVTAVGGGVELTGKNVVAMGGKADLAAIELGSSAVIELTHSNFDESNPVTSGATVTPPGSGSNQTAPPILVDVVGGDFRQLPGSPTIDRGAVDPLNGPFDFEGDPREQGFAPDIGADESPFSSPPTPPPPPPPPPDPDPPLPSAPGGAGGAADRQPPDTKLIDQPRRRTKRRRASFDFQSTEAWSRFECRLDRGSFGPCAAPTRLRVDRGKHAFRVRAVDLWGNADPSPAKRRWKVLPR